MAIKVGDKLPAGTLWEFIEEETPGEFPGGPEGPPPSPR